MIQTTVNAALYGDVGDYTSHFIYLYKDGDMIFYVGRSYDPINRLLQHMGIQRASYPSALGRTIQDNLPESLEWTLELYTLVDCIPLIEQHNPSILPHYMRMLNSEESFIADLATRRTDIECKFISDEQWERMSLEGFHQHLYGYLGDTAEEATITHYEPCLNYIRNRTHSEPLPDRYVKQKVANKGAKYGKVE